MSEMKERVGEHRNEGLEVRVSSSLWAPKGRHEHMFCLFYSPRLEHTHTLLLFVINPYSENMKHWCLDYAQNFRSPLLSPLGPLTGAPIFS